MFIPRMDGWHMRPEIPVVAYKEVLDSAVLTVGDNCRGLYAGIHGMGINEGRHSTCLTDCAGGCFYRGDDFVKSIDRPVRFVSEL